MATIEEEQSEAQADEISAQILHIKATHATLSALYSDLRSDEARERTFIACSYLEKARLHLCEAESAAGLLRSQED